MATRKLTASQERVLEVLDRMSHRSLTLGSIAQIAQITRPKATKALGELMVRGMVDEDHGFWFRTDNA